MRYFTGQWVSERMGEKEARGNPLVFLSLGED